MYRDGVEFSCFLSIKMTQITVLVYLYHLKSNFCHICTVHTHIQISSKNLPPPMASNLIVPAQENKGET